jgi:hypothetical protein
MCLLNTLCACRNFAAGGDWIIQPALSNSAALAALLPHDAPLSTLRVVTASIAWLQQQAAQPPAVSGPHSSDPLHQQASDSSQQQQQQQCFKALSEGNSSSSSSSSRGTGVPQVQVPSGCYRPGPTTPPLAVSAGVMRRLNVEGRWANMAAHICCCESLNSPEV